jgi:phosphatidylglycerophosphate synthase
MLDAHVRPLIDPPLHIVAGGLTRIGVSANMLTFFGFGLGLVAMGMIYEGAYWGGALFITLNRLLDGLDGAVARRTGMTDFGGFLDIVCDFIFYAGIVFAFGAGSDQRTLPALFLIFSFVGPMVSFLAYAAIAAKHQKQTQRRGLKSFYYLGGLCEGTETFMALILMCLLPQHFALICGIFGLMCWLTTLGRAGYARRDFGKSF